MQSEVKTFNIATSSRRQGCDVRETYSSYVERTRNAGNKEIVR